MDIKIRVFRFFTQEEILRKIEEDQKAHEASAANKKKTCEFLGLIAQSQHYTYKTRPEKFYRKISDRENSIIVRQVKDRWEDYDGSLGEFNACEIPEGVLEEVAFAKNNGFFQRWQITQLKRGTDFWFMGINDGQSFLIARWGEDLRSFREIELEDTIDREEEERKKEEKRQKLKNNVVCVLKTIPLGVMDWVRQKQCLDPNRVFQIVGKCLFDFCCRSRMFKVVLHNPMVTVFVCNICRKNRG